MPGRNDVPCFTATTGIGSNITETRNIDTLVSLPTMSADKIKKTLAGIMKGKGITSTFFNGTIEERLAASEAADRADELARANQIHPMTRKKRDFIDRYWCTFVQQKRILQQLPELTVEQSFYDEKIVDMYWKAFPRFLVRSLL
jgi:hypothetical protein